MSWQGKLAILAIVSIISGVAGYRIAGRGKRVETKTEVVREQVVVKDKIVTRTVERPDGTKETVKVETLDRVKDLTKNRSERVLKPLKKEWRVGAQLALVEPNVVTLNVERRMLWDVWAGVYARTDKEVGLSLSFEF